MGWACIDVECEDHVAAPSLFKAFVSKAGIFKLDSEKAYHLRSLLEKREDYLPY